MKRITCLTSIVVLLVLTFTGCGSRLQPIDVDGIALILGGATVDIPIVMEVENEAHIELVVPVEGEVAITAQSDADGLDTAVDGTSIALRALLPGDYAVAVEIAAEGYDTAALIWPVTVVAHTMELVLRGDDNTPVVDGAIRIQTGAQSSFVLESAAGATHRVEVADTDIARAQMAGDRLTLYGVYPGATTLTFTAERELYEPAVLTMDIEVPLTAAALALGPPQVSLTVGESVNLSVSSQAGGDVAYAYDTTGLEVVSTGGSLSVKALKAGSYTLTATCEAYGYSPGTAQVVVMVAEPAIALSLSSSIALRVGESQRLTVGVTPADADITLAVSGAITATYADSTITVQGSAKGSGQVVVTARRDGYQPASATVSVIVQAALPNVNTTTYAHVAQQVIAHTNSERRAAGLNALEYVPVLDLLATVRAQEAASYWSHTRPDGREWLTVFADYDVHFRGMGENLFAGNVLDAEVAVDAFMDSPEHRANILKAEYAGIGVGIYAYGGEYFICQLFMHN